MCFRRVDGMGAQIDEAFDLIGRSCDKLKGHYFTPFVGVDAVCFTLSINSENEQSHSMA